MDVSREDLDRLTAAMQGMTGSLGALGRSMRDDREEAKKTLRERMSGASAKNRQTESKVLTFEDNLDRLSGSLDSTITNVRRMIGGFWGGAVIGAVLDRGNRMAKTFSELNEYGQNFGGSMLKMHQAAAAAGIPLDDFASIVKKNGQLMSKMGQKDFFALALNIRNLSQKQGLYGYTVSQLTDQLSEYLTTSALYGTASIRQTASSTRSLLDLAVNTSALAAVTKKSREEISKLANEAMRGALAIGAMNQIPTEMRVTTQRTMAEVTQVFAAQQGEAGRMLSKFVNDTFGSGFSALTETGKMINEAGLGGLLSDMDALSEKVRNNTATQEDAFNYSNKFKKSVEENSQMLTMLAASGNAQAAQMLSAAAEMKYYTAEEVAQARKEVKQRQNLTALFQSLEHRFGAILGALKMGFYEGIEPFLKSLNHVLNTSDLDTWAYYGKKIGKWFGTLISDVFNEGTIQNLAAMFTKIWDFSGQLLRLGGNFLELMAKAAPGIGMLLQGLTWLADSVGSFAGAIGGFVDNIVGTGDTFKTTLAGIGAALTLYFGPKILSGLVKGFFMSKFPSLINASVVNINAGTVNGGGLGGGGGGGSGGGGSGGGSGGAGGGSGRRGWKRFIPSGKWGKGLAGAAVVAAGLAWSSSAMAKSASPEAEEEKKAARPAQLRVLHADMISDRQERARFHELIETRLKIKREEQSEDNDKKLKAIDGELSTMRARHGTKVTDLHDFDYASLHGKLPPGAKAGGPNTTGAMRPQPATKKKKEDDDSWGFLDYASAGLGLASFVPGLGVLTGGLGAAVDVARGDYVGAGLSAASMIPFLGEAGAAGKMARLGLKGGRTGGKIGMGLGKMLGKKGVANGIRGAQSLNDFTGASMMMSAAPMIGAPMMAGSALSSWWNSDEEKKANTEKQKQDAEFTYTPEVSNEADALNKLLELTETNGKMMIQLLARISKVEQENSQLLTKIVTTR